MITNIKWGHNDENSLYCGAKGVFSVFLSLSSVLKYSLKNTQEARETRDSFEVPQREVLYLDVQVGIANLL